MSALAEHGSRRSTAWFCNKSLGTMLVIVALVHVGDISITGIVTSPYRMSSTRISRFRRLIAG